MLRVFLSVALSFFVVSQADAGPIRNIVHKAGSVIFPHRAERKANRSTCAEPPLSTCASCQTAAAPAAAVPVRATPSRCVNGNCNISR